MYINSEGIVHGGSPGQDSIRINNPTHRNSKLKTDWHNHIPDVWEYDLDSHKKKKCEEIDARTRELIAQGFEFDGKVFSLSDSAQSNLKTIQSLIDKDLLDPQSPLSTINDELYMLSKEDAQAFVAAGYNGVMVPKIQGTVLKGQVMACTTAEQIDSIIDNR